MSARGLRSTVAAAELARVGRGIYAATPRPDGEQRWLQELLVAQALHPDGRIGGQAAAALYGLDGFDWSVPISVHVAPERSGRANGVRRFVALQDPETVKPFTVVGPDETLLGLGEGLMRRPGCRAATRKLAPEDLVELAVEAALRKRLVTIESLTEIVRVGTRRPGRALLQEVLDRRPDDVATGSYLETRCVQVLRDAGLPYFRRQVPIEDGRGFIGFVDFHLDGIVIEIVGKEWHLDRFNPDHRRYARIGAAGYGLLPFTFDDIEFHPGHVVSATRDLLEQRRRAIG